jgi:putative transcriptional regulator
MENIKLFREAKGLTQEQLANEAGVSRLTIVNLENGNFKDVKVSTMKKISKVLEHTIDECFSLPESSSTLDK